jgi:hypothetical protein
MSRARRTPAQKAEQLHNTAEAGERIARLVEDKWFANWFAAHERKLMAGMIGAAGDISKLQVEALRMEALMTLKRDLMVEAERGRQARKALDKMENE